jgi:hypothetical protein
MSWYSFPSPIRTLPPSLIRGNAQSLALETLVKAASSEDAEHFSGFTASEHEAQ